jgi:hypothetical protein
MSSIFLPSSLNNASTVTALFSYHLDEISKWSTSWIVKPIFLKNGWIIAGKWAAMVSGAYSTPFQPQIDKIKTHHVRRIWKMGISYDLALLHYRFHHWKRYTGAIITKMAALTLICHTVIIEVESSRRRFYNKHGSFFYLDLLSKLLA